MSTDTKALLKEDLFPGNTEAFMTLKSDLVLGNTFGFVGAGASAPSFPTWSKVLHDLIQSAKNSGLLTSTNEINDLEKLIAQDPLEAASAIEEIFNKRVFRSKIAEIFRSNDLCTTNHYSIISLSLKGIITLNYDNGLEVAFVKKNSRVPISIRSQDKSDVMRWSQGSIFSPNDTPILHWHGGTQDPEKMIFTSEDYYSFYQQADNARFIENLWQSDRLLVIGFGFSDPFLIRIAEGVLRLSSSDNRHFAFIGYRGTDAVSPMRRRQFSKKYRLTPIFYQIRMSTDSSAEDHSDLNLLLEALSPKNNGHDDREKVEESAQVSRSIAGSEKSNDNINHSNSKKEFENYLFSSPAGKTLYAEPRLAKLIDSALGISKPEYDPVSVDEIIRSSSSYVIKANPEFGATTLCRRIIRDLHSAGAEAYLRDCEKLPNYRKKLENEFAVVREQGKYQRVLVLDDFDPNKHERLLKELVALERFDRYIIIFKSKTGGTHNSLTEGAYGIDFELIVLGHLDRGDIRTLSQDLFDTRDVDFVSSIVDKVYNDLLDLCIPLTPSNIIMYLSILHKEGDFQPLNRVQIVDRYIHELLRRPSDAYQDAFNAKNKIDVVSAFVYSLYTSKKSVCRELDWTEFCQTYKENALIYFDDQSLLNELIRSRVFLQIGSQLVFKYRFFYSYFLGRYVANRSSILNEFMAKDDHISAEGLVQVITSTAAENSGIVNDLIMKLESSLDELEQKYSFGDNDPFEKIEWPSTDNEEERLWQPLAEKLAAGPRSTQELDRLKTSIRAEVRTEDQSVTFREFDEVERRITAYAYALKDAITCSDALEGELKKRSLNALYSYYMVLYQIGLIYAPVIAKHKFTVWHDTIFLNELNFTENEDERKRIFITALAMGESVARKAISEIGTKKLSEVYRVFAEKGNLTGFRQLLNYGLVLRSKSKTWAEVAEQVILKTDRKSYYMRAMLELSFDQFNDEVNTNAERESLKRVVAAIRTKRSLRKDNPGSKAISRVLVRLEKAEYFSKKTPILTEE